MVILIEYISSMDALLEYSEQFRGPYWVVAMRLAVILIFTWTYAPNLAKKLHSADSQSVSISRWTWLTAAVAFAVFFSVGMLRHMSFHSKAWDLAIFDQVIWNLANGNGWECSVRNMHDLRGDHFEPVLLFFVPFYKILPHVGWLLGFQAAALVSAGLIFRHIYREKIGEMPSYLLFLGFCLYAPLHWLVLADFHPIALAPFFIAIGWLGSRRDNILILLAGLIGMALCGEEAFIVAGWWGLWEFMSRTPWRSISNDKPENSKLIGWSGLILFVLFWVGFIWLSIAFIPAYRPTGEEYFYIHRYGYLGETVGEIGRNFFTQPWVWIKHAFDSRGIALFALYLIPLGLVPLKRMGVMWIFIPTILYTLLSVSPEQRSIFHQYTAMWIPFLFIACGEAIAIRRDTASWTMEMRMNPKVLTYRRAAALFTASFLGMLMFSPILGFSMHPERLSDEPWASEAMGVVQSVGPGEHISAPSALCPHLSHRRILLMQIDDDRQEQLIKDDWAANSEVKILPKFPPDE